MNEGNIFIPQDYTINIWRLCIMIRYGRSLFIHSKVFTAKVLCVWFMSILCYEGYLYRKEYRGSGDWAANIRQHLQWNRGSFADYFSMGFNALEGNPNPVGSTGASGSIIDAESQRSLMEIFFFFMALAISSQAAQNCTPSSLTVPRQREAYLPSALQICVHVPNSAQFPGQFFFRFFS